MISYVKSSVIVILEIALILIHSTLLVHWVTHCWQCCLSSAAAVASSRVPTPSCYMVCIAHGKHHKTVEHPSACHPINRQQQCWGRAWARSRYWSIAAAAVWRAGLVNFDPTVRRPNILVCNCTFQCLPWSPKLSLKSSDFVDWRLTKLCFGHDTYCSSIYYSKA